MQSQATRTVERVGKRIAEASGLKGCKWEFIVVRDDNMNAFVLPGGKVNESKSLVTRHFICAFGGASILSVTFLRFSV